MSTTPLPASDSSVQWNALTQHYYQILVNDVPPSDAKTLAESRVHNGLYGYLANINDSSEWAFVKSSFAVSYQRQIWLGISDQEAEGTWKFFSGPNNGAVASFFDWNPGEPNNSGDEDFAYFATSNFKWEDAAPSNNYWQKGLLVEYGGLPATYAISSSLTSVNEGSSVTFTIDTKNIEWGKTVSYTLTGISQSDLSSGSLTGTATVNQNGVDGRATVTVNLANDQITEGAETLTLTVSGQQSVVTIQDTSITPAPQGGGSTNVVTPICFARGTLIHTTGEAIPVESLTTGSTVQNKSGGIAQCRWIGYQRRTPEFAAFQDYLPVRIAAGALDDNLPLRDLYLSPDHAVLVEGHLIHAKALVNGKTIVQMTQWTGDIEYYHIETEAHEIIYAEGVPCETFIDNVSREQFDNYSEYQALYPNTRMMKELPLPRVKFKRQLPLAIKQRLESRISELDRQHKV